MSISLDDVKRIARLARIRVSDVQAAQTQDRLNTIFRLIEEMRGVDTTGVEPMAHAQDMAQRLRPDVVTEPDRREVYQTVAPQAENGLYLVPKVIE
ncbi:MAG TPA: Asp-tRNA(Asn)/Glu-tRNA(Gln) amidotransferase subunit GatC [Thiobacillaceae bacterium]|nr:Asp-tRNA(Asn)/Glu-tRNA(Gln) amidotransferase subunit GatC [Thiobacillaceae bacterium]HNU63796.1 Asp-tRNA(Asn)/Glu-tRNA(Gln) amidotransferase subunit GatC [Thiobacillaceae bacterium]